MSEEYTTAARSAQFIQNQALVLTVSRISDHKNTYEISSQVWISQGLNLLRYTYSYIAIYL